MAYEIQAGLAGFGINEFADFRVVPVPTGKTALRSPAAKLTVARTPLAVPKTVVAVKAPTAVAVPNTVPTAVVPAVVNEANGSDPTAPPPMTDAWIGQNTPDPSRTVVIEQAPPGPSPVVIGAGLLVAAGLAYFFITRKGA